MMGIVGLEQRSRRGIPVVAEAGWTSVKDEARAPADKRGRGQEVVRQHLYVRKLRASPDGTRGQRAVWNLLLRQ